MKKISLFGILVLLFVACTSFADEYSAGKYSLQVSNHGDFSLMYDGEPLLFSGTLSVHNSKWEWILFDRQFIPTLSAKEENNTTVVTLSLSRPGVMENFKQTMTLTPDGLEVMYSGVALCDIFNIENSINLPEILFAGQEYSCRTHLSQTVNGVFAEDRPEKSKDDMCNGFVLNGNFEFDGGTLIIEPNTARLRLQDMRNAAKISYYSLGWVIRNLQKGQEFKQGYKITVRPADATL